MHLRPDPRGGPALDLAGQIDHRVERHEEEGEDKEERLGEPPLVQASHAPHRDCQRPKSRRPNDPRLDEAPHERGHVWIGPHLREEEQRQGQQEAHMNADARQVRRRPGIVLSEREQDRGQPREQHERRREPEPPHLVAAAAQSTGQPMDRPPEERELGHGLGRTVHIRGRDTTCGHP